MGTARLSQNDSSQDPHHKGLDCICMSKADVVEEVSCTAEDLKIQTDPAALPEAIWSAHPEIPFVRSGIWDDIVIANGYEGAIIEECDEHQHQDWQLEECRPLHSTTMLSALSTRLCSAHCSLTLREVRTQAVQPIRDSMQTLKHVLLR